MQGVSPGEANDREWRQRSRRCPARKCARTRAVAPEKQEPTRDLPVPDGQVNVRQVWRLAEITAREAAGARCTAGVEPFADVVSRRRGLLGRSGLFAPTPSAGSPRTPRCASGRATNATSTTSSRQPCPASRPHPQPRYRDRQSGLQAGEIRIKPDGARAGRLRTSSQNRSAANTRLPGGLQRAIQLAPPPRPALGKIGNPAIFSPGRLAARA